MSDIVKRLRLQSHAGLLGTPEDHQYVSYGDAADHIEKLEARVKELEAKLAAALASAELERAADDFMYRQLVGGQPKPRSYRAIFRRALKGRFS